MKRIMSVPKLALKTVLLLMILLMPGYGKAVPYDIGFISSCYQQVYFGANGVTKNIKLLYFGGSPVFSYQSTTGTDLDYFAVRPYDPTTGVIGGYIDLLDRAPVQGYDAAGNSVDIYANDQPTVTLPSGTSFLIDFYSSSFLPSVSITVDFIGIDEAFKIEPVFQSCFTYENFQFKSSLVQLEGFCGELTGAIVLPSGVPDRMGLPEPFNMDVPMPNPYSDYPASDPVNIPIDQDRCSDPNTGCQASDPCGCITFDFEFKLKPCANTQMICASETIFTKPIRICCRCAVPNGNPGGDPYYPSAGRNTGNSALTDQTTSALGIFPNPNHSGILQVNGPNSIKSIKIYAVDGRLVKDISLKEQDQSKVSVDISVLKPGLYQVKIMDSKNAISNQKLIVP